MGGLRQFFAFAVIAIVSVLVLPAGQMRAAVLSPGGAVPVIGAARPGEQVVFSFLNPPIGAGSIGPGFSSAVLVVKTDASSYAETVSSISGALAPNVHTLAPIAVPEPASLGLLAASALFAQRRRRGAR